MFKLKKIKFFYIGFSLIIIIFSFYHVFVNNKNSVENNSMNIKTISVSKGNIRKTIKVLGQAELVDEQKLRFNQVGKVTAVHFQDGDQVKQDQIIAELDKTEVFNEIRQAEISLENSRLSLQELLKGNTETQILKAKNSLSETKQKIDVAKKNLVIIKKDEKSTLEELQNEIDMAKKEVSDKEKSLKTAQKDLENTEIFETETIKTSSNSYQASIDEAFLNIKDAIIAADNILVDLDEVLGIEENTKYLNDSFKDNLGALNIYTKQQAEESYLSSQKKLQDLEKSYNELQQKENVVINETIHLLKLTVEMFQIVITATDNTYLMLQNSVTSTDLSSASLDAYKASVTNKRTAGQQNLSSIKNILTNLKNLEALEITELRSSDIIRKKEDIVRSSEYALEKAQDTLNNLKNTLAIKKENKKLERISKENEINNLENTLKAQEEELAELERGETKERITMAKNEITQKELALTKVQKNIEKYELRAPFDGILRKIDFKIGDNLIADDDKFVYIENPDLLKISILLDQIDVVKIKKGYQAVIVFDALSEKEFIGEIEEIDQTPVEQSGVVSYEAGITLHKENETIFSGMTASLEIIIQEKKDILIIPNLAISSKQGKSFVQKVINGQIKEIAVELGISDGKNTEVVTGLKVGDKINAFNLKKQNINNINSNEDSMRQLMRATRGRR